MKNLNTELMRTEVKVKMGTKSSSPLKNQRGISLYLSLVVMGIFLSLALGLNSILLGQIEIIQGVGNSVSAFYAADTGIERELYENNATTVSYSGTLGDSSYSVQVIFSPDPICPLPLSYCVKSVGTYKTINRAIYISR
jgi:hypothetical protein